MFRSRQPPGAPAAGFKFAVIPAFLVFLLCVSAFPAQADVVYQTGYSPVSLLRVQAPVNVYLDNAFVGVSRVTTWFPVNIFCDTACISSSRTGKNIDPAIVNNFSSLTPVGSHRATYGVGEISAGIYAGYKANWLAKSLRNKSPPVASSWV